MAADRALFKALASFHIGFDRQESNRSQPEMRKSSFREEDYSDGGAEKDEDEVEQRRREYLRRHREMLLQKQRLETVQSLFSRR